MTGHPPARRPAGVAVLLGVAFVLTAGCSSSTKGHGTAPASAHRPASSHRPASAAPVAEASTAPPSAAAVELRGDAATNKACRQASAAELERITGGHIVAELGLTGAGAYSKTTASCTWYFTPTEISSPVVIVQYGRSDTVRKDVIAYYRDVIKQGYGKLIPGVGDIAKWYKHDIDVIDGRVVLTVRTYLHNSVQEQATNLKVLHLVLPRAKAGR